MEEYKITLRVPDVLTPLLSRKFKEKCKRYIVKDGFLHEPINCFERQNAVPKRVVARRHYELMAEVGFSMRIGWGLKKP